MRVYFYSVLNLVFCLIMLFQSQIMYGSECSDRFSSSSSVRLKELFRKSSPYSKPIFVRQDLIKKSELFKPFWTSLEKPMYIRFGRPPFQRAMGITDDMLMNLSLRDDSGSKYDFRVMTEVYRFIHSAFNFYELNYIQHPDSPYVKAVTLIFNLITSDALMDSYHLRNLPKYELYKTDVEIYGLDNEFNELEELFIEVDHPSIGVLKHIYGDDLQKKLDTGFKIVIWSLGRYLYLNNRRAIDERIQRVNMLPPLLGSFGIMLSSNTMLAPISSLSCVDRESVWKFNDRLSVLRQKYLKDVLYIYPIYDDLGSERLVILRFAEGTFEGEKYLPLSSVLNISELSSDKYKDILKAEFNINTKSFLQQLRRIKYLDKKVKIEGLE